MWNVVEYLPTTLFSLKASWATSSGAVSLPVPTPFSIKMALLDACIRIKGLEAGKKLFEDLKAIDIRIDMPPRFVINKSFIKIAKEKRKKVERNGIIFVHYTPTVAFREFVYLDGPLKLAFSFIEPFKDLLPMINYFGKRGSFFQFANLTAINELGSEFGVPVKNKNSLKLINERYMLWELDDVGEDCSFDAVNIYSDKRMVLGRDRVRVPTLFPVKVIRSSKNYMEFLRFSGGELKHV